MRILIKNAQIVNEGKIFKSDVLIENDLIAKISETIPEENIDKIISSKSEFFVFVAAANKHNSKSNFVGLISINFFSFVFLVSLLKNLK